MMNDFLAATPVLRRKAVILEVDDERDFEVAFGSLVSRGAGALVIAISLTHMAKSLLL
jgi:hypothetical protein